MTLGIICAIIGVEWAILAYSKPVSLGRHTGELKMREKLPTGGILTPAYGCDYTSRKAIVSALNEPKDFTWNKQLDEGYCSITDLPNGNIECRYKNQRNVCMVKIFEGVAS